MRDSPESKKINKRDRGVSFGSLYACSCLGVEIQVQAKGGLSSRQVYNISLEKYRKSLKLRVRAQPHSRSRLPCRIRASFQPKLSTRP